MLILGLSLSAAACASMPEASAPMALGTSAAAPNGFVEFCRRQPQDCGGAPAQPLVLARAADTAGQPAAARAADPAAPAAPPAAPAAPAALVYDWSGVFGKAGGSARSTAAQPAAFTPPTLDAELWALINRTNETVNRAMSQRSDERIYGVAEVWTTPLEMGVSAGDCEDFVLEKRHQLAAAGVPLQALSIAVVKTYRGQTHAVLLVATDKGEYVLDNLTPWVLPWAKAPYEWRERQVAGSASQWAMAAAETAGGGLTLASLR